MNVCLQDVGADLSAVLSVWCEDVLGIKLGFVNEEMVTVSTQNVLGYHRGLDQLLYSQITKSQSFPEVFVYIGK